MHHIYAIAALAGFFVFPFLDKNPFKTSNIQVFKEGTKTYYILSENELNQLELQHPSIQIEQGLTRSLDGGGLLWGANTEGIQSRVSELRDESTMFNQILTHLEESEYPYSITNTSLESAYGAYSSKNGAVQFEVAKMHDFFFDATIIEEFVHAYQALYYNYTHGKYRAQQQKKAIRQGKDFSKEQLAGIQNWKKYGRKHAFIESEAKLITYFIQHQTCSISLQDIVDTDDYNTGGKGRKVVLKYLSKVKKRRCTHHDKLGHLEHYFIDLPTFALYQQGFLKHWRRKAPNSNYTIGYFYHKPDALNNLYLPITQAKSKPYSPVRP